MQTSKRYNAEIMPEGIKEEDKKHMIGAEICMWGESMGAGNLASKSIYCVPPRICSRALMGRQPATFYLC